ncbi:MAG: hypothetical protein IIA07_14145 [Proteobacteria bacterium]|nr:hypothetical protein [Pseudomonadota bacterium]
MIEEISKSFQHSLDNYDVRMRDAVILLIRLIATAAKLLEPRSVRTVVVELLLVEHLFRMLNRSGEREEHAEVQNFINKLTNREREVLDL